MVVGTTGRNCAALLVLAMVAIPARAQQTESAAEPAGGLHPRGLP